MPELAAAIAALPAAVREALAEGPRYEELAACGVCRALKREARAAGCVGREETLAWLEAAEDAGEPIGTVWAFHESQEGLIARAFSGTIIEGEPTDRDYENAVDAWESPEPAAAWIRDLAGAASFYRCEMIYLLAGWRPA